MILSSSLVNLCNRIKRHHGEYMCITTVHAERNIRLSSTISYRKPLKHSKGFMLSLFFFAIVTHTQPSIKQLTFRLSDTPRKFPQSEWYYGWHRDPVSQCSPGCSPVESPLPGLATTKYACEWSINRKWPHIAGKPWTSLGQVALHIRVWRSGRIWSTIFLICGSKPISSIRSASSNTSLHTISENRY